LPSVSHTLICYMKSILYNAIKTTRNTLLQKAYGDN
jgi:hypothetical protein